MKRAPEDQNNPETAKKARGATGRDSLDPLIEESPVAPETTWQLQHQDCRGKRLFSPQLWHTTLLAGIPTDLYAMIYVYWVHFRATAKPPLRSSYRAKSRFGSKENLCGPNGIAVDETGTIFVSDGENHRIIIFQSNGKFLRTFGSEGQASGNFLNPGGLIFDFDGSLIVLDSGNNRIQIFDAECNYKCEIGDTTNEDRQADGCLCFPCGITIDPDANFFVSDSGNHRIQIFNAEGKWIKTFGSYGPNLGQLSGPIGIAVDSNRDILVADYGNNRVQIFNQWGIPLSVFGPYMDPMRAYMARSPSMLRSPWGLLIAKEDEKSRIVVSDSGNHRIMIFSKSGKQLMNFGTGEMINPKAISMDKEGMLLIPDCNNQQIQTFG